MKFLGVLFLLLTSWVWSEENTYDETDLNNDYITTEALKKIIRQELKRIYKQIYQQELLLCNIQSIRSTTIQLIYLKLFQFDGMHYIFD